MAQMNPVIPGTYTPTTGVSALLAQPATVNPQSIPGTYRANISIPRYTPASIPMGGGGVSAYGNQASTNFDVVPFYPDPFVPTTVGPNNDMGEFTKGLYRGGNQLQAAGYGALGLLGDIGGNIYNVITTGDPNASTFNTPTGLRDFGYAGYQQQIEEAAQYPKAVERVQNIASLSDAGLWVAGTSGELIPNIVAMIIPGGVAAGVGRAVGGTAVKQASSVAVANLVAQGLTKEAALAQVNGNIVRSLATASVGATSSAIEAGSNWGQSAEARGIENTNPIMDLGFGIASGLTDVVLGAEGNILRSLLGRPVSEAANQAMKQGIAKGVIGSMFQEGGQEALQEILSITNQHLQEHDITLTSDDISDILNAAAAGMVGGGVMSPMTIAGIRRQNKSIDKIVDKPAIDTEAVVQQAPALTVAQEREALLSSERQRMEQDIAQIQQYSTAAIERERNTIASLQEEATRIEQGNFELGSPYARMTPEELQQEVRNIRTGRIAAANARMSRIVLDSDAQVAMRQKQYREFETRAETMRRKAAEDQWKIDNKKSQQVFVNQPEVQQELSTVASDVETFTNREGQLLDKRLDEVRRTMKEVQNIPSRAIAEGRDINEHTYKYVRDRIKQLQSESRNIMQQKRVMRRISNRILKNIANPMDTLVGDIINDVQDLYSRSTELNMMSNNRDIYADGRLLSIDEQRDALKSLINKINTADSVIDSATSLAEATYPDSRGVYGTISKAAKNALANARSEFTDEINTNESIGIGSMPMSEYDAMLVEDRRYRAEADEVDAQVRRDSIEAEQERLTREEEQIQIAEANRNAALMQAFTQPDTTDPVIAQMQQRLSNMEQAMIAQQAQARIEDNIPTDTAQDVEPIEMLAAMDDDGQQAVERREGMQAASNEQIDNGSELVESDRLTPNGKNVSNWVSNAMASLPLLADNTVIAVDGRDIALPVELQNRVFDVLRQTGSHPVGAYFNGKVYLFANAIQNKEQAVRALVHEGIAHYGLRCVMTPTQMNEFLDLVHKSFSGTEAWNNFVNRNAEAFQGMDRMTQAEEFVAYFAQANQPGRYLSRDAATAFQRLKDFLKRILQRLGIMRVTTADLEDVLTASAHYLANSEEGQYLNNNTEVLNANGTEESLQPATSTGRAWGIYFGNPAESVDYNSQLAKNVSGIPGSVYISYDPTPENTLNFESSLFEQSEYIKEMLGTILTSNAMEMVPNEQGTGITAKFLGRDVGMFNSEVEATNFMNSDSMLQQFDGQDLYDYISQELGSQKDAGMYLRGLGIFGANMTHMGEPTFVLFTGDDAALLPQNPSIPYEAPLFMQDDIADEFTTDRRGFETYADDTPVMNETMVSLWSDEYNKQTNWATKIRQDKKTGLTRNEDGTFEYGYTERAVEYLADEHRPIKLIQDMLQDTAPEERKAGPNKVIRYATNVYKMLTGIVNRIHAQQIDNKNKFVLPLMKTIKNIVLPTEFVNKLAKDYKWTKIPKKGSKEYVEFIYTALGEYMWARHAGERNAELNRRYMSETWPIYNENGDVIGRQARKNPKNAGELINPSGLSDAQARDIFEYYDTIPGFREAAQQIDAINKKRIDLLEEYRLINSETANSLRSTYNFYVPLKNWSDFVKDVSPGYYTTFKTSSGISVGGRTMAQYAKGRFGPPENPVVHSILQMYDVSAIGIRNNASRALLKLVQENPDPDLWEIPATGRSAGYRIENRNGELTLHRKKHSNEGKGYKQVVVLDENANQVIISIKDDRLANSLRGENHAPVNGMTQMIGRFTSMMNQLQTSLNPAFILTNPVRDLETAILNMGNVLANEDRDMLTNEGTLLKMAKAIGKDAIPGSDVQKMLYQIVKGNEAKAQAIDPAMYKDYLDFANNGGHTRMFNDSRNFDALYKSLVKETTDNTITGNTIGKAAQLIDDLSNVTENIARFSVYRNIQKIFENNIREKARIENEQAGREVRSDAWVNEQIELSRQKSANIALESTVNFTKKGSGASWFNALYSFSSATIQGSVRIMQNIWRKDDSTANNIKRLSKFVALGGVYGFMQGIICRAFMDDDDDGINAYDKIPTYEKYRNFIIPNPFGKGYVKIPVAYGYNIFYALGIAADDVVSGNKKATTASAEILKESLGSFSPIDPIDEGFTAFVPSIFRPLAQVAANTTFAGVPIYPENTGDSIRDSQKYWSKTPNAYKWAAKLLADPFGFEEAGIEISPETIEHVFTSYTGGLGRVFQDTVALLNVPAGAEMNVGRIPIVNRILGAGPQYNANAALYNRVTGQIEQARNAMKMIKDDPSMTPARVNSIMAQYQNVYALDKMYSNAQRQLSALRKQEQQYSDKYLLSSFHRDYNENMLRIRRQREQIMKQLLREANRRGVALQEGD